MTCSKTLFIFLETIPKSNNNNKVRGMIIVFTTGNLQGWTLYSQFYMHYSSRDKCDISKMICAILLTWFFQCYMHQSAESNLIKGTIIYPTQEESSIMRFYPISKPFIWSLYDERLTSIDHQHQLACNQSPLLQTLTNQYNTIPHHHPPVFCRKAQLTVKSSTPFLHSLDKRHINISTLSHWTTLRDLKSRNNK